MKRYLKLFLQFSKNNIIRELEFRSHFALMVVTQFFWVFMQVLVVETYFRFTDNIVGWTKIEVFVLIGMFRLAKGIFDTFIRTNVNNFPEYVRLGELDYMLTRPINSLFMMSTRRHKVSEWNTAITGLLILGYALGAIKYEITLTSLVLIVLLIFTGITAYYCLHLSFAILAIFMIRLNAIKSFHDVLSSMLRYPLDAVTRNERLIDLIVVPFALVVTIPVKILLGKIPLPFLVMEVGLSLIMFFLVYRFWIFALKHYSSASS